VITHIRGRLASADELSCLRLTRFPATARQERALSRLADRRVALRRLWKYFEVCLRVFPYPYFLVIHIGEPFSASFADWLDGLSPLRVRYATDGEQLPEIGQAGMIMAPPGFHLVVQRGKLRLTRDPERNSCRPSVDVLFESLAREVGGQTAACLLTGMGEIGAAGLLALRHAGALTIAQDEATSSSLGCRRKLSDRRRASRSRVEPKSPRP